MKNFFEKKRKFDLIQQKSDRKTTAKGVNQSLVLKLNHLKLLKIDY